MRKDIDLERMLLAFPTNALPIETLLHDVMHESGALYLFYSCFSNNERERGTYSTSIANLEKQNSERFIC